MTVHIVIPIKNELENLHKFSKKYGVWWYFISKRIGDIKITFMDDSSIYYMMLGKNVFYNAKYNIRFSRGCGNYGDSLVKGILCAGKYDKLIVMDIDHPITLIDTMIMMLEKYDIVIGNDSNKNNARSVTNWLCNNILGLNLKHPTCGFIGFNSYCIKPVDYRNIRPHKARSKRDIIHVEWMKEARNKKLSVGELDFYSSAEHNYTVSRCIRWLYDFSLTVFRNMINLYP